MKYAVLDETGDVGNKQGASAHFIVTVAVVGDIERLRRTVTRTRKRLDKRRRDIPEFKAFKTDPRIVRKLLTAIAEIECEIIVIIADKQTLPKRDDPESLYRDLCARAARRCVERHQQISLILDKRYTDLKLIRKLNEAISAEVAEATGMLVLETQRDSEQERALQAVDAVSWAIFQKLERGDESFYSLVKRCIVLEEWFK